jgi:hypothetical protein
MIDCLLVEILTMMVVAHDPLRVLVPAYHLRLELQPLAVRENILGLSV